MAKLFGFSIEDNSDKKPKSVVAPVPPNNEDGVDYFIQSGFYGQYVDIEGVYRTEYDLIRRYREMALHPECDNAIESVVNEAIVSDLYDSPVEIELSNLNASDRLKEVIRTEFRYIKEIMDFDKKCHEIFRNWYVDGRVFYLKVIDQKNPEAGIQELRYIDPMKIKHIRQEKKTENGANGYRNLNLRSGNDADKYSFPEIEEYFVYTPMPNYPSGTVSGGSKGSIRIAKDSITYCTSGLVDRNKGTVLSYLHKAIKALNQLRMIEDSLVIYRLSRAPERRIFYIDVGNLPKIKAEQYLREVMTRYRQKLVYDSNTGEIRDDRKHMSMLEDFWLPRREGGRGTEITTLPGGQNLGQLEDIKYFEKKLYQALNVPSSRLEQEGSTFNFGTTSQILRDELKFSKFVGRLRKKFSELFLDLLKTQLILKGIVTSEDWDLMKNQIQFDYLKDNHYDELKDIEVMTNRMNILSQMQPYIGLYYSNEYIRRHILRQTDGDIIEIDQQINSERKQEAIPDMTAADFLSVINGFPTAPLPEMPLDQGVPGQEASPQGQLDQQQNPKEQQTNK